MKKLFDVGACGNFNIDNGFLNGQCIRTCSIMDELKMQLGKGKTFCLSYHQWKSHPFRLITDFIKLMNRSTNVLLFPDLRAINVVIPIAVILKKLTHTRVYYVVIGGWFPEYLDNHTLLKSFLKKLDGIFVQTPVLLDALLEHGLKSIIVFPNFKHIRLYRESELPNTETFPLKLVFMSRITARKGVAQLMHAIEDINKNGVLFTLDIYGSIQDDFEKEFACLLKNAPTEIRYCGKVDPNKTSSVMKDYFLHVFPTTFRTEGYPGSVLDALSGGTPTLSARWNSYDDVLQDGYTARSFAMGDWAQMEDMLRDIAEDPQSITTMRKNCLAVAEQYQPEQVIKILLAKLKLKENNGDVC